MTTKAEHDARIGRVLSAVLQGVLAEQRTGGHDAGNAWGDAFLLEYRAELDLAQYGGPEATDDLWLDLVGDIGSALYSVVLRVAEQLDQEPTALLAELVRTYRKSGR